VSERRLISPTGKRRTLGAVRPNAGLETLYRRRLDALIAEMNASVLYWMKAQWRRNTPVLAQDDDVPGISPARGLREEMDNLGRHWQDRFDKMADDLARHFAKSAAERADGSFQAILKRGGWTVKFRNTKAVNDITQASIGENVALIRSIPSEYHTQVQGIVMRSVQQGRDLGYATQEIEKQFGVTRRRAAIIARDQNAKMTAAITRTRQAEIGVTEAIWVHSHAGKHPRQSHLDFANGKLGGPVYKIAEGVVLDGERVWPGTAINCRCFSKPIIEGFS
jgi:uncharacterized protein with gpF-like domain